MKSIKNIIKRITAMLLAITMTVGMMPIYSFATENESVYISISDDEKYVCDNNGFINYRIIISSFNVYNWMWK